MVVLRKKPKATRGEKNPKQNKKHCTKTVQKLILGNSPKNIYLYKKLCRLNNPSFNMSVNVLRSVFI